MIEVNHPNFGEENCSALPTLIPTEKEEEEINVNHEYLLFPPLLPFSLNANVFFCSWFVFAKFVLKKTTVIHSAETDRHISVGKEEKNSNRIQNRFLS